MNAFTPMHFRRPYLRCLCCCILICLISSSFGYSIDYGRAIAQSPSEVPQTEAATFPWVSFSSADGLANDSIFAVAASTSNHLWIGTTAGVSILAPDGQWLTVTDADGLAGNIVLDIVGAPSSPNRYWFATDGGATLLDDGGNPLNRAAYTWVSFTKADGLVERYVSCVAVDLTGRAWFGTNFVDTDGNETGYGVSALSDGSTPFVKSDDTWVTFTSTNSGLASNSVRDIKVDANGVLWFATANGLNAYDGNTWITYFTSDGLPSNDITSLLWHEGLLWIATSGGIHVRDVRGTPFVKGDDLLLSYTTGNSGLVDNNTVALAVDGGGRLWIGTTEKTNSGEIGSGVSVFDDGGTPFSRSDDAWRSFSKANGLTDNAVRAIAGVGLNTVWFGTRAGLGKLDFGESPFVTRDDQWTSYTSQERLVGSTVTALAVGDGSTMWLGTDQALSLLDYGYSPHAKNDDTWYTLSATGTTLIPGAIRALAVDQLGRLWIGSTGGLTVLDTKGTPAQPSDDSYIFYSTGTGLASEAVNDIVIDAGNRGWFVTGTYFEGGLHVLDVGTSLSSRRDDRWVLFTPTNSPLPGPYATSLALAPGGVWIATNSGVARLDPRGTPFDKQDDVWAVLTQYNSGLPENSVRDVMVDGSGNAWFGHAGQGVSVYTVSSSWAYFKQTDGLSFNSVQSLALDQSDRVWIGTDGGGISVLNHANTLDNHSDDAWTQYGGGNPLYSGNIRSQLRDRWGQMWIGSFGGGVGLYSELRLSKLCLPIVWRFRR